MPSSKAMWLVECSRFPPTTFVIVTNQKCQLYPFFLPPLQQTGHPGTSTPYRDKSELQNYVPPRRFRYASSHRFRTPPHTHVLSRRGANHAVAPKSAVGGHFHQPLLSLSPTKNVNYTTFGVIQDADCRAREPSYQEKHLPTRQAMPAMSHRSIWTMPANYPHRPYLGQAARYVRRPAM